MFEVRVQPRGRTGGGRARTGRHQQRQEVFGRIRMVAIGFRGQAKLTDNTNVSARAEFGVNLVDQSANEVFISGDNLGEERFQDTDDITTRLGQAGLVGDWGSVQIGKQWSVYYDVTQWTDLFWAVGGNASGTFREVEIRGAAFETQRVW